MAICSKCDVGGYLEVCRCKKTNEVCPFMRRCSNEHKWKPLNGMSTCTLRNNTSVERRNVSLKKGEYIVESIQNGKLYINVEGCLMRFVNPFDYEPSKVKLEKVDGEYKIVKDKKDTKESKETKE